MSETLIYIIIFAVLMFIMHRGHGGMGGCGGHSHRGTGQKKSGEAEGEIPGKGSVHVHPH